MEGYVKHTFGVFLEGHLWEEAVSTLRGVVLYTLLDYSHHPTRCAVMFVFSPFGDVLHICMFVAVWHHNSSHLWCLCSFIRSLSFCSSTALRKLQWFLFLFFFFAHQWSGTHCEGHCLQRCLRHNLSQSLYRRRRHHHQHWEQPTRTHLLWPAAGKLHCKCFMLSLIYMDDVFCFVFQCYLQVSHAR